jgi:hypothetical protein
LHIDLCSSILRIHRGIIYIPFVSGYPHFSPPPCLPPAFFSWVRHVKDICTIYKMMHGRHLGLFPITFCSTHKMMPQTLRSVVGSHQSPRFEVCIMIYIDRSKFRLWMAINYLTILKRILSVECSCNIQGVVSPMDRDQLRNSISSGSGNGCESGARVLQKRDLRTPSHRL